MEQFDNLENYVHCWPVNDFLKCHLKSTSAKWRCEQHLKEGALAKGQAEQPKTKFKTAKKSKVGYIFCAVHSIPDPRIQV